MGYYTNYYLGYEVIGSHHIAIREIEKQAEEITPMLGLHEWHEAKWYEHEDDVIALSKKFPDVLFTLEGHGEENGDMWKKYFYNGQCQVASAKITYEPCNLVRKEERE